jgi:hypothetical protein
VVVDIQAGAELIRTQVQRLILEVVVVLGLPLMLPQWPLAMVNMKDLVRLVVRV